MFYPNGQAAAAHVDQEHKQEKYNSKPNLGAHNVLTNLLKAVTWNNVQVSQLHLVDKNKLFNLSLFSQLCCICMVKLQ